MILNELLPLYKECYISQQHHTKAYCVCGIVMERSAMEMAAYVCRCLTLLRSFETELGLVFEFDWTVDHSCDFNIF